MEQSCVNDRVLSNEILLAHREELPVEMDFVLPDACGDIAKILRCRLECCLLSAEPGAEGVTLEGSVTARVFYIGEEGFLCAAESRSSFTRTSRYDLPPAEPAALTVSLEGSTEYVNVRAVNQRRVEVKGAMSLWIQATGTRRPEFLSQCGEQIQCREEPCSILSPVLSLRHTFLVEEELSLNEQLPGIGTLLELQGEAQLADRKLMEEKAAARGELRLHGLYLPDNGEAHLCVTDWSLPVSCLCEVPGLTEDCSCQASLTLVRLSAEPKADGTGAQRLLTLRAELAFELTASRQQDFCYFSDAYSVRHPLECRWERFPLWALVRSAEDRVELEKQYEAPMGGVTDILDPFAQVSLRRWDPDGEGAVATLRVELGAFLLDANGRPALFERAEEYQHRIPLEGAGEKRLRDLKAGVRRVHCYQEEGTLRFTLELWFSCGCFEKREIVALQAVQEDTGTEKPAAPPLTLYYARAGESAWEIAKAHNAPLASFLAENGLAEPVLTQPALLLIQG